eukprot:6128534-Pleurochrysis_carterae.AAC.1
MGDETVASSIAVWFEQAASGGGGLRPSMTGCVHLRGGGRGSGGAPCGCGSGALSGVGGSSGSGSNSGAPSRFGLG